MLMLTMQVVVLAVDEPIFEANISAAEIALDETLTLTITVRANSIGKLRFPVETEDFIVVAQSQATNIKIVNGARSQQHRITLMIEPKHVGKFTLPSAAIDAGGFTHTSDPVTIAVLAARNPSAVPASSPAPSPVAKASTAPLAKQGSKVFARLSASNVHPYMGEQIKLKMRIYHQGNVKRIDFNNGAFSFDNFLQEKIDGGVEGEETIDGVKYYYYEMASILYPVKAGTTVIPVQTLKVTVVDVDAMRARAFDPFAQLVARSFESEQEISSNNLVVNVRSLPSPAPKGFSGYVGTLSLSSQLDKTSVEEGTAAMLTMVATGTGNAKSLVLDLVPKSNQYTIFEDKKNINASVSGGVKSFRSTARKAIIPKRSGKLTIDLAPLIYFNPASQRYETISGRKLDLDVIASTGADKDESKLELDNEQEEANTELMSVANTKILARAKPFTLPLWLMFGLIILLNMIYVFMGLRGHLAKLTDLQLGSASFAKTAKAIKTASSIDEVTVLLKDLFTKFELETTSITEFFAHTDQLLYSGQSEGRLEEVKAKALELIEELKRNAK